MDITHPTTNVTTFIILLFRHFGQLGNIIFFICSAWFLTNHTKTNYEKILYMLGDIFVVSVLWLVPMLVIFRSEVGIKDIIISLLPTFFGNNWYLTTYIIFCFIYPILNAFIEKINQRTHLLLTLISFSVFILLGTFYGIYGINTFLIWSSIYISISYIQKYHKHVTDCKKINVILMLVGVLGFIITLFAINIIGLKIDAVGNKIMHLNSASNIFFWIIAYSSLNLFRGIKWHSKVINYLSSLSLLIYVIHENILFRSKIRPLIWNVINTYFGGDNVLIWIGIYVLALFLASYVVAIIYDISLRKLIRKITDYLYRGFVALFHKFEKLIIKEV